VIRFDELVRRLIDGQVEFVVIGGVAAVAQGYDGSTFDFDVCARFTAENLDRMLAALRDVGLRFAPPTERPVTECGADLATYRYLAWRTDLGRIDVIRDVAPLGSFDEVVRCSEPVELYSRTCLILGLDGLIAVKEHLGRDKDKRMLPALRALKVLRARR
jgi:hypothetical protein